MARHDHHHHAGAFRWSVLLNAFLTGAQLAIGFGFGSLALIGDAIHNLGDVVGLLLAWGAERLSLKPPAVASPMALAAAPTWRP